MMALATSLLRLAAIGLLSLSVSIAAAVGPAHAQSANELARAGFAAKERRDFGLAVRLLSEAIGKAEFTPEQRGYLFYSRGVSLEGLGRTDAALADFDAAIALIPNFANSYIYRAVVWNNRQVYDRAIADLERARALNPADETVFMNLGNAYAGKGDVTRALASLDEAIRLRPSYAAAYFNRALTRYSKGDVTAALQDYDQTLWLEPGFVPAYTNRGGLRLLSGDGVGAIADFSKAIQLSGQDVTLRTNRANAFLSLGRFADAVKDFDRAVELAPDNASVRLGRGRARLFGFDQAASIEDFEAAVRIQPANPYAVLWLHIARVHDGHDDSKEFARNAAVVRRDAWPTPILDLYLRIAEPAAIRSLAGPDQSAEEHKRRCEADFFIGEFLGHEGKVAEAKVLLRDVLARCRAHDVVYSGAIAELKVITR
jgi:lipoprotein NlpI